MENYLILILVLAWVGGVAFFRIHRIWLLYYLTGALGLAFAIIFAGRSLLPLETLLERYTALNVHQLASLIGVETRVFEGAPGALLVLVIAQEIGWTVVQITVECSGLLESAVFLGMLMFYPGWSMQRKLYLAAIGLAATYAANLVRLLFIISTLHWVGKDSLFMAHTLVGRFVFFIMVVFIYWFLLTLPTLRSVGRKLQEEMAR